ncbi:hypothetical protein BHM03_00000150 [Ensete ventricosum]|nr:hypothetical protein BHM03_00000150 [Ensete ventricosum]
MSYGSTRCFLVLELIGSRLECVGPLGSLKGHVLGLISLVVQLLGCHGPLANRRPGRAFLPAPMAESS